jgi:hypothetical protein
MASADELVFPHEFEAGKPAVIAYRFDVPTTGHGFLDIEWSNVAGRIVERRRIPLDLAGASKRPSLSTPDEPLPSRTNSLFIYPSINRIAGAPIFTANTMSQICTFRHHWLAGRRCGRLERAASPRRGSSRSELNGGSEPVLLTLSEKPIDPPSVAGPRSAHLGEIPKFQILSRSSRCNRPRRQQCCRLLWKPDLCGLNDGKALAACDER